jgi:hypothetical protein
LYKCQWYFIFTAYDGSINGEELWKSDGTEAGTVMVKDINPGASSVPDQLTDVNGTLFLLLMIFQMEEHYGKVMELKLERY